MVLLPLWEIHVNRQGELAYCDHCGIAIELGTVEIAADESFICPNCGHDQHVEDFAQCN